MTDQPPKTVFDLEQKINGLCDWQSLAHKELKSINSKLTWFVVLSILAVLWTVFSSILG